LLKHSFLDQLFCRQHGPKGEDCRETISLTLTAENFLGGGNGKKDQKLAKNTEKQHYPVGGGNGKKNEK